MFDISRQIFGYGDSPYLYAGGTSRTNYVDLLERVKGDPLQVLVPWHVLDASFAPSSKSLREQLQAARHQQAWRWVNGQEVLHHTKASASNALTATVSTLLTVGSRFLVGIVSHQEASC